MGRLLRTDRFKNVHPRLHVFASAMADSSPFNWIVVTGVRTQADVDAKYAIGRTLPGPHAGLPGHPVLGEVVTQVHSLVDAPHALRATPDGPVGCAVDLQFYREALVMADGSTKADQETYAWMGALAEKAGLVWGGRFRNLFDQAHVELCGWRAYPLVK